MLKTSRLQEIKNILEKEREVITTELSQRFNVSEMTIRRDLDTLAKDNAIIKTRGGAYLAPVSQQREPSYSYRRREANDVKDKILAKAVEMLEEGLNIFLDSGTTTEYFFRHVNDTKNYMIVTNGINIVRETINHSHISAFLVGGEFRANTFSSIGPIAEEQVERFHYDVSFLGTNAVDDKGNAYVGTSLEVGLKRKVMENSERCYVLADSSKFGKYSLISYINLI